MTTTTDQTSLSKSILKTLLYFDIFQYPLTSSEIINHLTTNHITPELVQTELTSLSNQSIIYPVLDFFSVHNNPALGSRRLKGNQMALQSLSIAKKQALFISKFPFVRSVMASGSLSKDYMDENSDLDFFIITKRNRLWTARMILGLYQKIFLFDSHKYFCLNYFVDEHHLEIEEKNLYTATELATLIPLYGKEYYPQLMIANDWVNNYLPNHIPRPINNVPNYQANWIKRLFEAILHVIGAAGFEKLSMHTFSMRWKKLYEKKYSKNDFEISFKTKEYVSKGHPKNHQGKVLDLYRQKLEEFGNKLSINWNE